MCKYLQIKPLKVVCEDKNIVPGINLKPVKFQSVWEYFSAETTLNKFMNFKLSIHKAL